MTERDATTDYQDFVTQTLGDPAASAALERTLSLRADADPVALARLRAALGLGGATGSLAIALDADSVARLRALATRAQLRADHVTLAYGLEPARFDPRWVPGGGAVGVRVRFRAIALCEDARVQAAVIEMPDGTRERPWDRGTLHVTVSRALDARSVDANRLLREAPRRPIDVALAGVVVFT